MSTNWTLPVDVNIGRIFTGFTAPNTESFKIEVVGEEWKDQCLELIFNVILTDDPIIAALGISSDPVSVDSLKSLINWYLGQNIAYGCFLEKNGEKDILVAVDLLHVRNCYNQFPDLKLEEQGKSFNDLLKYIRAVERLIWYPKANGSLKFLTSFGIIIMKKYRDLDIEINMIRLRKNIAKELRIDIVASVIIGKKLQKMVVKKKYCHVLHELNAEKIKKYGLDLSSAKIFPLKIMGKRYYRRPEPQIVDEEENDIIELSEEESSENDAPNT